MKLKKVFPVVVTLAAMLLVTQCMGIQVPKEKQNYIGVWETPRKASTYMYLKISANGQVEYKREEPGISKSITGPLTEFNGDNFKVAIAIATTEFVVSKKPYKAKDGRWHMVVDGIDLTKVGN